MMVQDFTAVDVETTGLNPKTDKLIEVGAVKVRKGQIVEVFESFVSPGRRLDEKIVEITGITDEMLKGAPPAEEVLPRLLDLIGDDVLIGHSLMFDFSFLKRGAANAGILKLKKSRQKENDKAQRLYDMEEKLGIDTLKIARQFLPDLESRSLPFLCRHFEIPHKAHRALEDARATAALYQTLGERFGTGEETSPKAFSPFPLEYKVKREAPASTAQKERLYLLIQKHKLIIDYEIDRLTRNEASRIIDRIISEHGRL